MTKQYLHLLCDMIRYRHNVGTCNTRSIQHQIKKILTTTTTTTKEEEMTNVATKVPSPTSSPSIPSLSGLFSTRLLQQFTSLSSSSISSSSLFPSSLTSPHHRCKYGYNYNNDYEHFLVPQLEGISLDGPVTNLGLREGAGEGKNDERSGENSGIWLFAVPKSKHSKSRKRMKTTVHKRLKTKKNIVFV